jgi:hypothetical protein
MKRESVRRPTLVAVLFALLSLCVSGCATCQKMGFSARRRRPGFPRLSYDEKALIRDLEEKLDLPAKILGYYNLPSGRDGEAKRKDQRDLIISGRLSLINLNYNQFLGEFSLHKQAIDTGFDLGQIGVSLATAVSSSTGTQSVLGATSAAIASTRLSVDKNFFYEKTVPVLISAMNARRKEALIPILEGVKRSDAKYPLPRALSDLDYYYFAGTFPGALQSIQKEAGQKEGKAEVTIGRLLTGLDEAGEAILKLRDSSEDNRKALLGWIGGDKEIAAIVERTGEGMPSPTALATLPEYAFIRIRATQNPDLAKRLKALEE